MRATALVALLALAAPVIAAAQVPEPGSYRTGAYRAPVPNTLDGATVVDANGAHGLWQEGRAIFVDVLPRPPKPANLPADTIWREKPRVSIPGATWLPNTGYGDLAPETVAYFEDALAELTEGDKTHPVLFFCLPECWMSWNAARRAMETGYSEVFWFPGGSDAWAVAGYPTEEIIARPGEPAAR